MTDNWARYTVFPLSKPLENILQNVSVYQIFWDRTRESSERKSQKVSGSARKEKNFGSCAKMIKQESYFKT